jgi:ribosomal protein S21|tara:strand:+ start:487 stop:744 length:258 start_codon:yes stop_codon:yes gene_type:complete
MSDRQEKKVRKEREEVYLYGFANGVKVINNNVEAALRKWKRMMKDNGVIDEIKQTQEYTKPTTKKRKQRKDAIYAQWVKVQQENR